MGLSLMISNQSFSQNNLCESSLLFCTDSANSYPAGVNAGTGQTGPEYTCLGSQPNPAWFYMEVLSSGPIIIYISSTPNVDIDFTCWGPFTDQTTPCTAQLTAANTVDCSYSTSWNETADIPNAQAGQFYILMITNFSNQPCDINFHQTNASSPGHGIANCGISVPIPNNNGPLCIGSTLNLTAHPGPNGCTYFWTGPNAFTSTQQNPAIPNVTTATAGDYYLQLINGPDTSIAVSTLVVINPVPTSSFYVLSDSICANEATTINYNGTATSNATYYWDTDGGTPGMLTGPGPHNISWGGSGLMNVGLHVTENGCSSPPAYISVFIKPSPVADAGNTQTISGGTTANLSGSATGGSGNYSYSWSPANLLQNANIQNPTTINLSNSTDFILSVTDNATGCVAIADVQIMVTGGILSASANANPVAVCQGVQTTLHAIPSGGTGIYTYSWTSIPAGYVSTVQNPVVFPSVTTQYIVQITSGIETASASVAVQVNSSPNAPGLITGPTSLCKGSTNNSYIVPSLPNATGYTWILPNGASIVSGQGTNSIIVDFSSVAISGGISVMGTNACGTGQASSIVVTVHSNPVADAGINQTVNSGTIVHFYGSASGGSGDYSYFWSPANLFQNAGLQNSITIGLTSSAIITLVVVDNITGCSGSDIVQVIVTGGPLSVIANINPSTICQGNQINLQSLPTGGSGNYTYSWTSVPAGFNSSLQNTPDLPAISTQYTVNVSDGSQSASTSVSVIVNPLPNPAGNITGPSTVSQGATGISYSVPNINNATNYIWSFPQGVNVVSGNNTNSIVVDFSANATSGIITVYGNNSCGYGASSPVFPVTMVTGIDEVSVFNFNLYPNPANDIITIEMNNYTNDKLTMKIYNIVGELVFEKPLNTEKRQSFHLNNFANGLYSVNITGNKFNKIEKLIIQK